MVARHDVFINMSQPQMKKLASGGKIRLTAPNLHGQHHVKVSKVILNKIMRNRQNNKGMDLAYSNHMDGSGFFSSIGNFFKKAANTVYNKALKPAGNAIYNGVLKPGYNEFSKDPIGYTQKGIELGTKLYGMRSGKPVGKGVKKAAPKKKAPAKKVAAKKKPASAAVMARMAAMRAKKGGSFINVGY